MDKTGYRHSQLATEIPARYCSQFAVMAEGCHTAHFKRPIGGAPVHRPVWRGCADWARRQNWRPVGKAIESMPFILLASIGLIWGVSYPITAVALRGFDVLTLRCLIQMLGAGAMLLQTIALAPAARRRTGSVARPRHCGAAEHDHSAD